MSILELNTKSSITEIIDNRDSGVVRPYLLQKDSRKKNDIIVSCASNLVASNHRVYLEVKFDSQYSQREKRIEIVSVDENNTIYIYKLSNFTEYDKDAIELDRLRKEIQNRYLHRVVKAIVYLDGTIEDITRIQNNINEITENVIFKKR